LFVRSLVTVTVKVSFFKLSRGRGGPGPAYRAAASHSDGGALTAGCQRSSTVLPVGHRESDWQPEWQAHAAAAGVDSGSAWAIRGCQ